jgi:hypothetical protein
MTEAAIRKLDVYIGVPAYGGNGGVASESPDVRDWMLDTVIGMKADPRIGRVITRTISDTPITHVRNKMVLEAREIGAHLCVMIDSDMNPQKHKDEPWYKPFWKEALDTIYAHYDKGPLVVGAPYCGPPDGGSPCYVFHFVDFGYAADETQVALEMYDRHTASLMSGVQECAALPTGLIMFDMRIFDVTEPCQLSKSQVLDKLLAGEITKDEAIRSITEGWFYYEWKNGYAAEKASTEDVTATRDMMFACIAKLGFNPLRAAWNCWAGHHKPTCVGKPRPYTADAIGPVLQRAYERGIHHGETIQQFEASPEVMDLFKVVA